MKRILTLTLAIALAAGATQARVTPSFAADSPPSLVAMPGGPISGRLSSGAAFVYQRTSGAPIAVVELWYRAPATGFGPAPIPSLSRLAAEAVLSSKPLTAKPLGSTLSDMGGRINVSAYADSIVIAATVPSASAKSVVQALTRSFFAPVLTDDGFKEARREVQMETLL